MQLLLAEIHGRRPRLTTDDSKKAEDLNMEQAQNLPQSAANSFGIWISIWICICIVQFCIFCFHRSVNALNTHNAPETQNPMLMSWNYYYYFILDLLNLILLCSCCCFIFVVGCSCWRGQRFCSWHCVSSSVVVLAFSLLLWLSLLLLLLFKTVAKLWPTCQIC